MSRDKDYIDNLNLNMKTILDLDVLLTEYEEKRLTRDEFLKLSFLAHTVSMAEGYLMDGTKKK